MIWRGAPDGHGHTCPMAKFTAVMWACWTCEDLRGATCRTTLGLVNPRALLGFTGAMKDGEGEGVGACRGLNSTASLVSTIDLSSLELPSDCMQTQARLGSDTWGL